MDAEYKQNIDKCLDKNSKAYFLFKRLKDYETRMHYHGKWTICDIVQYEKRWQKLSRKYETIDIYGIQFGSIGETIPRLFMYLHDRKKRNKNAYHIVLPTFFSFYIAGIVNNKIFDVFGKYIHFITEDNIDFWKYVILFHLGKINTEYFNSYLYRDCSVKFNVSIGKPIIPFSKEAEVYAAKKLDQMGVKGKFICIHAREVATKKNNFISSYDDTSILDVDVNSFRKACEYLQGLGYQIVRIGKDEKRRCEIEGVIDYANDYYDAFMDFYLVSSCEFLLGGMAGIMSIAAFWGRPVLQSNAITLCYGQESLPRTKYDLYLPKKFYLKRKQRFLNLYEMLNVSYKCDRYNKLFDAEGVEVINNTEEEILNATIEMNQKLCQVWTATEDEIRCMKKYWEIIDLWKRMHRLSYISRNEGGRGREMLPCPICFSYLKDNMYLLDVKELYEE